MKRILFLKNPVLDYAWGSKTAIAELLGEYSPSEGPQAELWMGAHLKASSTVVWEGKTLPLSDLIARYPDQILGTAAAKRFGARLPYLFKVLAAAEPLSIQAHPDRNQARQGFERENRMGIALDAPERNYRDDNHKPECICALTRFWGLNGFCDIGDILDYFARLEVSSLDDEQALLRRGDLKTFFESLMTMDAARKKRVTAEVGDLARVVEADDPVFRWISSLQRRYPGDIGILAPIFLNLVCLRPGQAMFLEAGELHSYLEGTGIELMASSDNVLRGGLTSKHVDVPELLQVLNFESRQLDILEAEPVSASERVFPSRTEEFALSVIDVKDGDTHESQKHRSAEILLCTAGRLNLLEEGGHQSMVTRGASFLVPAAAPVYRITGNGTLYKASVPR
ncbi:MAG: mannose-6-phosphate isomerase, class I [Desulfobacterales bacterium]|nr:mannose-6-phosphate isomerase, class I [Desulfobacterales bacterium]